MDINGKVAVVTGGASGIGQAVTRRIAAAGGKVVIFDLNEDAGQAMVAELGADNCVFANVNVVDEDSAKAGIEATKTKIKSAMVNIETAKADVEANKAKIKMFFTGIRHFRH